MMKNKLLKYLNYGLFVFECICLCNLWLGIINEEYGLKKDMGFHEGIGVFELVAVLLWISSILVRRYIAKKSEQA